MATATTLAQAAGQAYDNLAIQWGANNLKTKLTQFYKATIGPVADVFPEQDAKSRPVANWLTIIAAMASQMDVTNVPIEQLTAAATAVYKTCWLCSQLVPISQVSTAQATALLAAYNAAF